MGNKGALGGPLVPTLFAVASQGASLLRFRKLLLDFELKQSSRHNKVEQRQEDQKGQGGPSGGSSSPFLPWASAPLPAPHSLRSPVCRAATLRSPPTTHPSAVPHTLWTDRQRRLRASAALLLVPGPWVRRAVGEAQGPNLQETS